MDLCNFLMAICKYRGSSNILKLYQNSKLRDLLCFIEDRWPGISLDCMSIAYSLPNNTCLLYCDLDFQNMFVMAGLYNLKHIEIIVYENNGECSGSKGGSCDVSESVLSIDNGFEGDDALADFVHHDEIQDCVPTLLTDCWQLSITGLNQEFKGGAPDFRNALIRFSIYKGFDFDYERNNSKRITAVCRHRKALDCLWRIHATADFGGSFFYIREYVVEHTCGAGVMIRNSKRMNSDIVAEEIAERIRVKPLYRPIDVVKDFSREYGFDISYKHAWNGVEKARALHFGDYRLSYDQLRLYVEAALQCNPGSHIILEANDVTKRFMRIFVSFHACIEGFKFCRPIIFLDGTFLTGRFRGQLLCATSKDGNQNLFPIAFAIVDIENEENWVWFMQHVSKILQTGREVTFLSDRHKGLLEAVSSVFPGCPHSYCTVHIKNNLRTKMIGKPAPVREGLLKMFDKVTYAFTVDRFNKKLEELKGAAGTKVAQFIDSIPPEHYANAHFRGMRYGEVTSNAAESLNNKFRDLRELPILGLVDGIRTMLMEDMTKKRDRANSWKGVLCPAINKRIVSSINFGKSWDVKKSSDDIYEVCAKKSVTVNLALRTCSCHAWQATHFPCSHSLAAIQQSAHDLVSFVDPYYHIDMNRKVYALPIFPVPTVYMPVSNNEAVEVLPPISKSQPGRRRKRRIASNGEAKREYKCGRCRKFGHNKKGCRERVEEKI